MSLSTQPYKGTRDFYPEDMRLRQWMFNKMRMACESFGYEETDSPVLEPIELYTSKTSEEIVNEQSYSFTDRGGRKVIMRPEMTPSISRMVAARRQELPYPFRVYNICNYFRYERPQKGRLREFWQLNADIFGVKGIEADAEIIQMVDSIMKAFSADEAMYEIRVNSRVLLEKRIKAAGLKSDINSAIRVIDLYEKLDRKELSEKLTGCVNDPEELLRSLEQDGPSEEVKRLIELCEKRGVKVKPVETLARGFDYYTDIVFEVFDKNPDNNRSMFGGGRYDGLVGLFGVEPVPTVGFAMGDVTLENFLKSNNLIPDLKSATDLMIIGIDVETEEVQKIADQLRSKNLNVATDITERKLDKKIKAAEKLGINKVVFIGESELKDSKYTLKNLDSGSEGKYSVEDIRNNVKEG